MQLPRLILLGIATAMILLGLFLAPDVSPLLPGVLQLDRSEWTFAAALLGYLAAVAWTKRAGPRAPSSVRLARGLERVDALSGSALRRWLFLGMAGTAVVWLAGWVPHYLFWPWCRDVEAFSEYAHAWDMGEPPYRDIRGYNFPGHIYLHWLIGKLVGWGRPWAFYAVDVAALLSFGAAVLAWSRSRFQSLLPGMSGYLFFLAYYLDQHFEVVAERDWHAALGATLGLLVLELRPDRVGRWLSALLAAAAFVIRPHVVLFFPALGYAAARNSVEPEGGGRRLLEWGLALGVFATAGFAPLVVSGVLDDLVRGLRVVSYGGPYSTFTTDRALSILAGEVRHPATAVLLTALAFLSLRSSGALRESARTWLVAMLGALVYRPLHPMDHGYLRTPLVLVASTAWAIPIAACLRFASTDAARPHRSFLVLWVVALAVLKILPGRSPYNCSLRASLEAIRAAAVSEPPPMPPGAWIWFDPTKQSHYTWEGYIGLLRHVRETTGPNTIVANALNNPPFPCVNGPSGRRSPFHVETGVAWMWLVKEDLDEAFARDLERAGDDSVVVWAPDDIGGQPRLRLPKLSRAIRDEYEPEATFGKLEVWRRKRKAPPNRLQWEENGSVHELPRQDAPP